MTMKSIAPIIKGSILSILGLIMLVMITPLILSLLLVFFIYSSLVTLMMKIRYGNRVTRAIGPDSIFGRTMKASLPYVNTITLMEGQPCLQDIMNNFQENILDQKLKDGTMQFKKLIQLFEKRLGYYIWKDCKEFDLKNQFHLKHLIDILDEKDLLELQQMEDSALPISTDENLNVPQNQIRLPDGKQVTYESLVHIVMQKYGATPMDKKHPKWSFLVIVLNPKKFMILFRIHHSFADGITLSRFILEAMLKTDIQVPFAMKKIPLIVRVATVILSWFHLPYELFDMVIGRCKPRNPLHGSKLSGKKIYLASNVLHLQTLKTMKRMAGTSMSNVLLACLSKAVANYFQRKKKNVKCITGVVTDGYQDMTKDIILRNDFELKNFKLPTCINPQPHINPETKGSKSLVNTFQKSEELRRLQLVAKYIEHSKTRIGQISLNVLGKLFSFQLPAIVTENIFTTHGFTFILSNVPGPQTEINYWGGTQRDMMFWVPDRDPMGMGVSVMSYNGNVRVCISFDQVLVPNKQEGDKILADFENYMKSLESEIWKNSSDYELQSLQQAV